MLNKNKSPLRVEQLYQITGILKNKIRLNIFYLLIIHKRLSLGELHIKLGRTKATIVHHMKKFEKTNLIFERHEKLPATSKIVKIFEINPIFIENLTFSASLYWSNEQLENPENYPEILEFYQSFLNFNSSIYQSMQIIFENLIQKYEKDVPMLSKPQELQSFFEENHAPMNILPLNDELLQDYQLESKKLFTKYVKLAKNNYDAKNFKNNTHFAYHFLLPASIITPTSEKDVE